jgi:hypothetical protein
MFGIIVVKSVLLLLPLLLQAQKRFGVQIQVIPETADGDIDTQALEQLLQQQVRFPAACLVACCVNRCSICVPFNIA